MKETPRKFAVCLVTLICLLLFAWAPIHAQTTDLLLNSGFEAPYNTLDGDPPKQVAQGWAAWHNAAPPESPGFVNVQPEYEPTAPDVSRINSGSNAQLMRAFYATFDGGVYQRVTGVTAGAALEFSVNAYVWSTTYDEVDLSELDGDVFVQVGIDPSGGTDPQSSSIVWSAAGVENYDSYSEYSVEADAAGTAVTVFVRASIGEPVRNTVVYLDDASLTAAGSQPEPSATTIPPSETSVPPTSTNEPPTVTSEPPTATNEPPTATDEPPTATDMPAPTETEPGPGPSATPDLGLTATSIVENATATAVSQFQTQTAAAPSATPTTDTGPGMTATAIVEAATSTVAAQQTQTAAAPTATATPPLPEIFPSTIIHTVRPGETVSILAARYGSTIQAIAEANGLDDNYLIRVGQGLIIPVRLPAPATSTPTATPVVIVVTATRTTGGGSPPPSSGGTYVVQPGDTLSGIASRFNTTVFTLAQLNGIVNIKQIRWGQVLRLPTDGSPPPQNPSPTPVPSNQTYVVQPGDSLYRISLIFGVPIARIVEANSLTNPNFIFPGQVLRIP